MVMQSTRDFARAMAEDHRQITAFDHAARRALIRPVQPEPQTYAWLWWAAAGLGLLAGLIAGGL